jgi:hypothetical protein
LVKWLATGQITRRQTYLVGKMAGYRPDNQKTDIFILTTITTSDPTKCHSFKEDPAWDSYMCTEVVIYVNKKN